MRPGRGGLVAHVSVLVEAIARGDRWAVARRATGPLLEQLLSGDFDDTFGTASESDTTGTVRPWFVASLTQYQMLDNEFQRRVQHESFPIDADLDIIAAHGPLDVRAASIDWDDDSVILRRSDTGVVTVAEARAETATWPCKSWHWLADEAHTFTGLYLRGCHPELVREFPPQHPRGGANW
ncbi:hypothetical protein HQO42_18530 [Rhodococcus fascians]|nr:hypothetical protein [Rhodococcus fascians]MBY4238758.1 hypothetical protein [Rhodococcus fascians]MBY4254653.1 hypothetical protein [Rhodococcus fascians]MBY4270113.1 hypothetical protein [Rhodococcus fascians]